MPLTQGPQRGLRTTMEAQGPQWGLGIQGGLGITRRLRDHIGAPEIQEGGPGPQRGVRVAMGPGSCNGAL